MVVGAPAPSASLLVVRAPRARSPCLPISPEDREAGLVLCPVDASVRLGLVGWVFQTCNTHSSDVSGAFMLLGNATRPS